MTDLALQRLEIALADTSDLYIPPGTNAGDYVDGLRKDIRTHLCAPFELTAEVMPPGFPDAQVGKRISGICLAHSKGYWLVFDSIKNRFYCFWGTDKASLGAHGVYGSPLYCWSA